jgi:hypothetical protein
MERIRRKIMFRRLIRAGLCLGILAGALTLGAGGAAAAGPPTTCSADLVIFTTSTGTVSSAGQVTHFRDSGVAGQYTSGFLAGYALSGAQDIMVNANTQTSQLRGEFTAVGPDGTLTVRYTGHADLTTGAATGRFVVAGGTGAFENFHWNGSITAQQPVVGVPLFNATDTGSCHYAP